MATNFPTSLDGTSQLPDNAADTSPLNNPDLATAQNNQSDAIMALEAKVGANSSTVTTSFDYLIYGHGLGIFNVKDPRYGAKGDGTTDDTAAIQAASDAAYDAGGGLVWFPEGFYVMSGEITPKNSTAQVEYAGVGWGNPANTVSGSWEAPTSGSVIKQTGAGLNCFHINKQIAGIAIRDLAVQFTNASTGHGIFFDPETFLSGTSPGFTGLPTCFAYRLSNLLVFGHDAGHYAYYFGNCLNGDLRFLNASGLGGFYKFLSYHPSGATAVYNFGNAVMSGYWQFAAPQGDTYNPTVAPVSYEVNNNTTAGTPVLNYVHHRGVLDIVLNTALTENLIELTSTGSQSGTGNALTIETLVQNDLGTYTAKIDNGPGEGLFVGINDEIPNNLSWTTNDNFRYEYTPITGEAAASGSAAATVASITNNPGYATIFRVSANLNVNTYTSGTVEVQVTYTSGWDSTSKTLTLCSLGAAGETSGSQLIYAKGGGTTITIATAGTFTADFHCYGIFERLVN